MFTDFILNHKGHGQVGEVLEGVRFDPGLLRPYEEYPGGPRMCTVNTGRQRFNPDKGYYEPIREAVPIKELVANGIDSPAFNSTLLRKEEWIQFDNVVIRAARQRLRAWMDLLDNSLVFGGFNGMAKMILEHETASDPGKAYQSMDGLEEGTTDQQLHQLEGLPLPITHSPFGFSSRRLAISRNTGTPLDSSGAEAAGRRVAELVEEVLIGTVTGVTYGGSSTHVGGYSNTSVVPGYTNYTDRNTKTDLTTPTGSNPDSTLDDVLTMIESLRNNDKMYGPYMLYHSTDWDKYMDNDYLVSSTGLSQLTLRNRLRQIEDIIDVRRLDFLTNTFTLLLVQFTPDVVRAVNGMDLVTIQWDTKGGMQKNFKVMVIWVGQIRSDFNGNCGIMHGTTS